MSATSAEGSPVLISKSDLEDLLKRAVAAAPAATSGDVVNSGLSLEDIERTTERAVQRTLMAFGIDTTNPIEAQKDFAFIRYMRIGSESIKSHGMKVVAGAVLTALIGVVTWAFKTFFKR